MAAFTFLGSIPECREQVQSLQSAPSTEEMQRRLAPDPQSQFLSRLRTWLATGRTSINYEELAKWDRMSLCNPFWKDMDFCKHSMRFMDEGANTVRTKDMGQDREHGATGITKSSAVAFWCAIENYSVLFVAAKHPSRNTYRYGTEGLGW